MGPHAPHLPTLPGELVQGELLDQLRQFTADMCGIPGDRFPGSQPVSFNKKDLTRLLHEDYWVCEKSDGIRVLVLIASWEANNTQEVYIIDRKNDYRRIDGLFFAHHVDVQRPLGNTLIDGELVVDVEPHTGEESLRLLAFDCLVVDKENIMGKNLDKRYGRLQHFVIKPYLKMIRDHPTATYPPFDLRIKQMERSYAIEKVLKEDLPNLQHGNDGLIYTCAESVYVPGTDERILKWKPPQENSIDFKLELRFPGARGHPHEPDLYAKPIFVLMTWTGDSRGRSGEAQYEFFDVLHVDDSEWDRMKATNDQFDDRIVEVIWDAKTQNWRITRFRDDKLNGNHSSIVQKIMQSIRDGVEVEELLQRANDIKSAWKARETIRARQGAPPPPPQPAVTYRVAPSTVSKVGGPTMVAGMLR